VKKKREDIDWSKVFELRCMSKRGQRLTEDEQRLVDAAFKADRRRYAALERPVFEATKPFGSR
jgi:hypothetical protein